MKVRLLTLLSVFLFAVGLHAQPAGRGITGTVTDASSGEVLPGAVVTISGTSVYAVTDLDGNFSLKYGTDAKSVNVEVSLMGYQALNVELKPSVKASIALKAEAEVLEDALVVAYGKQSKMTVTGSIATIGTKDLLKSPSGSAANALAGAVAGISSVQMSGQPGASDPVLYVRGSGSLTESASHPLILVDGVERSFFQMDPNEIESISVLKDAASTAVFGVKGANGVILVTTRRGNEGKASISISSSFGLTQALRNLYGVSSYEYASLYTEAERGDNPNKPDKALTFSPYVTELFRTNADPIMFPNVEWANYIFKDFAWQTQHNVNLSGGGPRARYFISAGFLHQDGMMKQFDCSYNTNFNYDRYNYRANLDIDLTTTTLLSLNVGGRVGRRREPNTYDIWRNVMWCTPFASPGIVDGKYIYNPNNRFIPLQSQTSGLDLYYNWGYFMQTDNVMMLDASVRQDLGMVLKGLSAQIKGSYNTNYSVTVNREPNGTDSYYTPVYVGTLTQPGMDISNPRFNNTIVYRTSGVRDLKEPMSYSEYYGHGRNWYLEASLNWDRTFGDHDVTALFLYNQSKTYYPAAYSDIPTGYIGYVGRVTYNYKKKYLADFNVGYNGSENFAPGRRYGFFPAGSLGWVVSAEDFMKNVKFLDFLKLRASYGLVGNDKYSGDRFLYLPDSWVGNNGAWLWGTWQFGAGESWDMLTDAHESSNGNPVVSWEKCAKQNYAIDMKMFNYRLSLSVDVFFEHRWNILTTRNTLPNIIDATLPLMNIGVVDNRGFEVQLGWNDRIGNVEWYINGNLSFARNKIIYKDEVIPNEPYKAETGRSTGMNYGYIFDRFLQPSDFDENGKLLTDADGKQILPTFSLGNPKPGDVLYKDLNGDGVIDGDDNTWFGYSARPEYVFGIIPGVRWKGFEFSMQWTGAANASRVLSGEYRIPFGTNNSRALLRYLADGRYHEGNEQNARFPRLTFENKDYDWNTNSDLWLMDASYLRLKLAEISYTLRNSSALRKAGITSAKFFINGYNLLTLFSPLAKIDIDPESGTGGEGANAYSYPNSRIYNIGFNLTF